MGWNLKIFPPLLTLSETFYLFIFVLQLKCVHNASCVVLIVNLSEQSHLGDGPPAILWEII